MKFRLSKAAEDYWQISMGEGITAEYAINTLTKHLTYINPERPLARHMADLLESIIHNHPGSRSNHACKPGSVSGSKPRSKVIHFHKEQ